MSKIIGLILRSGKYEEMKAFYIALGLNLNEHSHGGPQHIEVGPVGIDFVVEVYRQSPNYSSNALMVSVVNLTHTLQRLESSGIVPHKVVKEGEMVYVKDPEGSDVMLVQL